MSDSDSVRRRDKAADQDAERQTLPLPVEWITSPNQIGLDQIMGYMLYPDDAELRRRTLDSLMTFRAEVDLAEADIAPEKIIRIKASLFDVAANAWLPDEAWSRYQKRLYDGALTGLVVNTVLNLEVDRGKLSKVAAFEIVRAQLAGRGGRSIANRQFSDIFDRMRPAGHLWGVHMLRNGMLFSEFPCAPNELADFISLSDKILHAGAAHKLAGGGATLLSLDNCWHFSTEIVSAAQRRCSLPA